MKHQELIDRGMIDPSNPDIVHIGKETVIGNGTRILTHCVHRMYNRDPSIIIDDYVWIGYGCIILPGVHIGKGSVVGAGSVVTKSCSNYSVIAGNPAKFIRKRELFELFNYIANRKNKVTQGVGFPDWGCLTKDDVYDILGNPCQWIEIYAIYGSNISSKTEFNTLSNVEFIKLINLYKKQMEGK